MLLLMVIPHGVLLSVAGAGTELGADRQQLKKYAAENQIA